MMTTWLCWLAGCGTPQAEPAPEAVPEAQDRRTAPVPTIPDAADEAAATGAGRTSVSVFFLDQARFDAGQPPYLEARRRKVKAAHPERNALLALFRGPSPAEAEEGLSLTTSGATGFENLTIAEGIATLQLVGGCVGGGATLTIYDHIEATLEAFDTVDHVKLLDPQGATMQADSPGDSRPECLEP